MQLNESSQLSNVTLYDLETKMMIILMGRKGQLLSDKYLYNCILDKLGYKYGFICPNLKPKFFTVLRSLESNDGIKVIKKNNIYYVVYSDSDKLASYDVNMLKSDYVFDTNETNLSTTCKFSHEYVPIKYNPNEVVEYLNKTEPEKFNDCLCLSLSYVDPENGNTIYHDLVRGGSVEIIQKLLKNETMNFTVKNKDGLTPLDYISDMLVARLFINQLYVENDYLRSASVRHGLQLIENDDKLEQVNKTINNLSGKLETYDNILANLTNTCFYVILITFVLKYFSM